PWFIPQPHIVPPQVPPPPEFGGNRTTFAPSPVLADVDGDGSRDLLELDQQGRLVVAYGNFGRENLLKTVTNGLNERTQVEYRMRQPLLNGDHDTYTPTPPGGCSDGERVTTHCLRQAGILVSGYDIELQTRFGEFKVDRHFSLTYEGARQGYFGRGFLGFDKRTIEETRPPRPDVRLIQRVEVFEDNAHFDDGAKLYPFAGLEQRRIVTTPFAKS